MTLDATLKHQLDRAEQHCRRQGARLTARRRQVLEILCRAARPLGAYEILEQLRDGTPLAPPTIYRALDFLLAQGLIHRLETLHAFVRCVHPEQPHPNQFLICADCGQVREIEDQMLGERLHAAAAHSGFEFQRSVVEVLGRCANCAPTPVSRGS